MDISRIFPQSYDVSDINSEEFKDFREDFKFTFVVAYLKAVRSSPEKFTKTNFEKVIICLAIAERRIHILSGQFFQDLNTNPNFSPGELD